MLRICLRCVMRGVRRTIGTAKVPKAPATNDRLLAMVAAQKWSPKKTKWVVESQSRDGVQLRRLADLLARV
jgi:hypothetical protein